MICPTGEAKYFPREGWTGHWLICPCRAKQAGEREPNHPPSLAPSFVMAGLDPAIHVFVSKERKAWMPATGAGMTPRGLAPKQKARREGRAFRHSRPLIDDQLKW